MSLYRSRHTPSQVVVTGLGVISPYGRGCQAYWQGLSQGRCAIRALSLFPTDGFRSRIGAEVCPESFGAWRRSWRSRATRFIMAATEEAVHDAALRSEELAAAAVSIGGAGGGMLEAGVVLGTLCAAGGQTSAQWAAGDITSGTDRRGGVTIRHRWAARDPHPGL